MSDDLQTDRAHAPRSTPRWLRALAADFIARVNDRGMTLSMPAAETLLAERISSLAGDLRISERSARAYVDHVALDGLAESLVASFHDEAPAADLFALPRTSAMAVSDYGRLVAALAECAQFFGTATQLGAEECRSRVLETAQLLALAGLMQAEHGGNDIAPLPQRCSPELNGCFTPLPISPTTLLCNGLWSRMPAWLASRQPGRTARPARPAQRDRNWRSSTPAGR